MATWGARFVNPRVRKLMEWGTTVVRSGWDDDCDGLLNTYDSSTSPPTSVEVLGTASPVAALTGGGREPVGAAGHRG